MAAASPGPPTGTRLAFALVAALGAFGALLFIPAGRLDWVAGWLYFGMAVVNLAVNYACLRRWNPELIERRMRLGDGTKAWDKVWAWVYTPVFMSIYVVAGPYRFVRHPGYLGFLGWILSAPLLLGSWWAFVSSLLSGVGLVVRTALEDRTLRRELAGYAQFAQRVRYRLMPGVW